MKKGLILVVSGVIFLSVFCCDVVMSDASAGDGYLETVTIEDAHLRAPQVVWRYREYNGRKQKRLWSHTSNSWLTDWIDV